MFNLTNIPFLIYTVISLIIAFTIHELAHAFVATKLGDPTPKIQGRLTINPLQHIDILGFLMIFLLGFGWAKPVTVNYSYFSKPRLAGTLVALSGPVSNLVMALLGIIIININFLNIGAYIITFLAVFIRLNIVLFVFNLLPIPPLDGYHVLYNTFPSRKKNLLVQYERYGYICLLFVFIFSNYTVRPLVNIVTYLLYSFVNLLFS